MNFLELIFTVCAIANANVCEDKYIAVQGDLHLTACVMQAVWFSGGGGNCTRVPRSIGDGLYVRSRSFDCRPQGPGRQGPVRLIPS